MIEKKIIKKVVLKKPLLQKKIVSKSIVKKREVVKQIISKKVISKSIIKEKIVKRVVKIEIKNVQDILKTVGNKDFFEIYKLIFEMDKDFFTRGFGGSFEDKKEVLDFFEERIFDFLKSVYGDLKLKIKQLRKKGFEVDYFDFKVLTIPLKMKMLGANFCLRDFLKVKELIDLANKGLAEFKIED